MSLNNSPHPSTHASSLSPPPFMTDRHSPESQSQSPSSYDAAYYPTSSAPPIPTSSARPEQPRRSTVAGYPTATANPGYAYDTGFQQFHTPSGMVAAYDSADSSVEYPSNGVLPYPSASGAIPFPTSSTQPSASDLYLNGTPEFAPAPLQTDLATLGVAPRDYLDAGAYASQPQSNPVTVERNLIHNIVQQALSAQQALDRGERLTFQERLAEITKTLRNLGTGVLGLQSGGLPPLVDEELPTGAASAPSLSPPLSLGANSSPMMYVGEVGANGAKRCAELDEGPKKAPKLSPPREMEKNSPSPGHSPPMGVVAPPNGLTGMHPPLMHAHTFPGGLHAPHVSSPLAGLPYESIGAAMGGAMGAPPMDSAPSFRSEPSPPSMASADPVSYPHMHAYPQSQTQGHHAHVGYQISRPSSSHSMHSDDSDCDSDDGHRHVKQEPMTGLPLSLNRQAAVPRQSPPKTRMGRPGDATPDTSMHAHSANALPTELKSEVDRIFFKYLNRICSNLDATDGKGEAIHQTLMAKKMARLDELPDFRPFKFRIQAFTNGFLEELASAGYPDEVIPMKKIKSYLWNQPYISRFNEDGKKAKSKGNHIWNIDARKIEGTSPTQWTFREFKRKIAGTPPGIAYHGHLWQWAPHVWDPQVSRSNITSTFSSPSLPPWLSWKDGVLSGTPGPDAMNTDITVIAQVQGDSEDQVLSHTFHLTIAPGAVDPAFVKSRRPSLVHDIRRNVSDSAVARDKSVNVNSICRTRAGSTSSNPSDNHQVMQVLASAVSRVTHAAHAAQVQSNSPFINADQVALAKQQQVLGATAQAVADEVRAGPHPDSQGAASVLVAAAHSVVVGAAQLVVTDRVAQATRNHVEGMVSAASQAPISVTEVSVATQSAVAQAVAINGPMATEVEVMMTANALIQQQQFVTTNEALEATQGTGILNGTASGSVSPQLGQMGPGQMGAAQMGTGQIGDHRSRSMSALTNPAPNMVPMNVGLATGLGPGLDGMSAIQPAMHGMAGMVSGMQ
ncbi:Formin-like protein 3 [Ceratobasidium sp. AG-Ba]|nr:Formin-like protein 3 [Ceratobasidium sp. AG-Ba]